MRPDIQRKLRHRELSLGGTKSRRRGAERIARLVSAAAPAPRMGSPPPGGSVEEQGSRIRSLLTLLSTRNQGPPCALGLSFLSSPTKRKFYLKLFDLPHSPFLTSR